VTTVVSFKYDPFGRRIYKSSSTGTSVFAYDGDNLVEETNSSGAAVARYAQTQNIDEPLAMLRSAATSYYHADGLGSISSLSNAAGTIANTYTYDSFGKLTNSTGSLVNPFRYTARESDTETGLYYYRARYYDSNAGRFLSEDRLQFKSGDVNFYAYVGDNPTNAADPLGLCKVIVRYTRVWGWTPFWHAYVVTIDPSGQMMGIRAGPGENTGNITTPYGPYDKDFPDFEPDVARNPEKGKCNKVLDDNKPCTRINYLLQTAFDNVESANIPYNSLGPNSNSVVPYALGFAGLPVPTPPVFVPGWGMDPFPSRSVPTNPLDGFPSP